MTRDEYASQVEKRFLYANLKSSTEAKILSYKIKLKFWIEINSAKKQAEPGKNEEILNLEMCGRNKDKALKLTEKKGKSWGKKLTLL